VAELGRLAGLLKSAEPPRNTGPERSTGRKAAGRGPAASTASPTDGANALTLTTQSPLVLAAATKAAAYPGQPPTQGAQPRPQRLDRFGGTFEKAVENPSSRRCASTGSGTQAVIFPTTPESSGPRSARSGVKSRPWSRGPRPATRPSCPGSARCSPRIRFRRDVPVGHHV
jgi:hypothetical protein